MEMKGTTVKFDRKALCSPAIEAALEEFDPREPHGESSVQDDSAGFIARAGAVNNQVSLLREQRRVRAHFLGRDPLCAWDDDGISQHVQRLPNVKDKHFLV